MQIIEYYKLENLIKEYIDKNIPLSILISEYNISYKQINYIRKRVKEISHIKDTQQLTNEDYINMFKYIENAYEELNSDNLPIKERINLEFEIENTKEEIINNSKYLIEETFNIFFNGIDLEEDAISYGYEAISKVLNDYKSNSKVNFIALIVSKIIKTIQMNFKEIKGITWEEYTLGKTNKMIDFKSTPKIIDIDEILSNKPSQIRSEDDEKIENNDFISDTSVEDEALNNLLSKSIEDVLETLPNNEATVIKLRYGLSGNEVHTYAQIANKLNITIEMVKNRESAALKKLRHPERLKKLFDPLNRPLDIFAKNETINDRIYLRLIDLLIHNMGTESLIKFINMEGVNWEKQDYINATLNLSRMLVKIIELKNEMNTASICNNLREYTNNMFSMPFLEKLVNEYSNNKELLNKLHINENEMKL